MEKNEKLVAIVCMSAKPFHKGHYNLIMTASNENDVVELFVSTSDRKRPNELPILGRDMERIWKQLIVPTLPTNVNVHFGGSPIGKAWELLGKANEEGSKDTFVIYSDPVDLHQNFPERLQKKYASNLFHGDQIILRAVKREETGGISGTKMRQYLSDGDKKSFIKNLPGSIDGEKVWQILNT